MQLSLYGAGTNNEHQGLAISCGEPFQYWPFNPIMAVVEDCWWDGPLVTATQLPTQYATRLPNRTN